MKSAKKPRNPGDAARRVARRRLERDGASYVAALQGRVRTIAQERNIRPVDFAKLMYKRITISAVMASAKSTRVSFDWLLAGDLRG